MLLVDLSSVYKKIKPKWMMNYWYLNNIKIYQEQKGLSLFVLFMVSQIFLSDSTFKESLLPLILWDLFSNCLFYFILFFAATAIFLVVNEVLVSKKLFHVLSSYIPLYRWQFHCKNYWYQFQCHYIHILPAQKAFELHQEFLK